LQKSSRPRVKILSHATTITHTIEPQAAWRPMPQQRYGQQFPRPSLKSLLLAVALFLLTLGTALAAGTQFAVTFKQNQPGSFTELFHAYALFYQHPAALLAGLPFALTLLTILLAHELGHFFACRRHHIHSSYPFFIPFPSLIGTFGAFILMRSPIRTNRSLFDVGASGPLVGFVFAVPALLYGILHAKLIATPYPQSQMAFGNPLLLHILSAMLYPNVPVKNLLIDPIGRAAWVGLFATSLNLLPAGQLDGGHILRSISPRAHQVVSWILPVALIFLGYTGQSLLWYVWAALLLGIKFLRVIPIYDPQELDPPRRFGAFLTLLVFVLSFMPMPIIVT
jgi:membrane-associated protease RseP (regulator of RpoE activity)